MLTLIRQLRFYVRNVVRNTSNKHLQSDKSQDYSQDRENHHSFQSLSSPATNVDMSTQTFNLNKEKNWTKNYSGLQDEIYDDIQ